MRILESNRVTMSLGEMEKESKRMKKRDRERDGEKECDRYG